MGGAIVPPPKLLRDAESAKKFEIIYLVCKLWVCKVHKTLK